MASPPSFRRIIPYRSIIFKIIVLFVLILLVAVIPLALSYYEDSRNAEIKALAAGLKVAAQQGVARLDPMAIVSLRQPEHMYSPVYQQVLDTLKGLENEFGVDDAILMRRHDDGRYTYIAVGSNDFRLGEYVLIHSWFPPTYEATEKAWQQGSIVLSPLFGVTVINQGLPRPVRIMCRMFMGLHDTRMWHKVCSPPGTGYNFAFDFPQFVQINAPIKIVDEVVAILMLNKDADPVAEAVRTKTMKVVSLTVVIVVVGLCLFGYAAARMLRPLKNLTAAASEVAHGNVDVIVPPVHSRDEIGRLTVAFDTMLEGLRQRDFIRDTFGRYLSKEIVEELLGSPDGLRLGGEICAITILVADLRGFTSMSANLSPHDVIDILNQYLGGMVDVLTKYHGTVDEFLGDGILAFFGAPLAAEDDHQRAIACAIEMQCALTGINVEQRRRGLPELRMGIGISSGEVIVGNIGSEKRMKYGAVGSTINEAYRIESCTIGGQILISPTVYEHVRDLVQVQSVQAVQFKGFKEPVTLYDIVGIQGKYACTLPEGTPETFVALATPLPIVCFPIEAQTVSEHAMPGTITHLAETSAEGLLHGEVVLHSNLKLHFNPQEAPELSEVYAKVIRRDASCEAPGAMHICIGFTSLPEDVKMFLVEQRAAVRQTAG